MKTKTTVIAAGGTIIVGWWLGLEAILDRLGYITFVLPLLPEKWQRALVSDPVLIWVSALLFVISLALLWNIAWSTAKATDTLRESNKKAWKFEAEFASLRDDYAKVVEELQTIHDQQKELLDGVNKRNENIDSMRSDLADMLEHKVQQRVDEEYNRLVSDAQAAAMNALQSDQFNSHGRIKALQREIEEIRAKLREERGV